MSAERVPNETMPPGGMKRDKPKPERRIAETPGEPAARRTALQARTAPRVNSALAATGPQLPAHSAALTRKKCQVDVAYETLRRFVQRRERPRSAEPEPVAAAPPVSAAPLSDEAKPRRNFGADNPRTTTAAIEEKRPRLSPEERAAQVEFIRSLNK
jgi:hypothetical protein